MKTRVKWLKISGDVEVWHDEVDMFTWVLTRNRFAGKPNRWDLIRIRSGYGAGDVAVVMARECPPGQCRRIVNRSLLAMQPIAPVPTEQQIRKAIDRAAPRAQKLNDRMRKAGWR